MNWETYIAFGDSITIGARTYLGYPELVGDKLSGRLNKHWNVINHSVSGFKAIDLARYIDKHFSSLQEHKKYVDEIKEFVETKSNGAITCEEQSLYRALRKYEHINVLSYELRQGNRGPERKYYYLTALGQILFDRFVERNIQLFYSEEIKRLLKF